ncbi:MAG: HAMP domain-containing sensor histidine kinase [Anaerolineae bacterium]
MANPISLDALLPRDLTLYHQRLTGTRWVAGAGILVLTLISTRVFELPLPEAPLLLLGVFVLAYNALLSWIGSLHLRRDPENRRAVARQLFMQIGLDWLCLILFIYLTGGISSPALALFFLHVIMVTILLPAAGAYAVAALVIAVLLLLGWLEAGHILPHYAVVPGMPADLYQSKEFTAARMAFFGVALMATVYITRSIMKPLRDHERHLFALFETSQAVGSSLALADVMAELSKHAMTALNASQVAIYLLDRSGRVLTLAGEAGAREACPAALPVDAVIQRVLKGDIVLLAREWATDSATNPVLFVPIIDDRPLGILRIESGSAQALTALGEGFLRALANQGAAAIKNALAHEALQQADKQRNQFVHIVMHELRAPVVGAQSLVRVLLGGLTGTLTGQQQDLIDRLSRRMDALLELINDLLSLAASTSTDFQQPLVPLELQPLLCRSVDIFQIQAEEKQIHMTCQTPEQNLSVLATEQGLHRIFDNLIGNALKYTPPRGSVCICLQAEAKQAVIRVQDTGIGIPAEVLPQIGQEFYRAPNAREAGLMGTGLGVALVKQLVGSFSGQLEIESEVGKGSTFTVRLPLVPAAAHAYQL